MPAEELRLPAPLTEGAWRALRRDVLRRPAGATVVLDCAGTGALDGLGAARLLRLVAEARAAGREVRLAGMEPSVREALAAIPPAILDPPPAAPRPRPLEAIGQAAFDTAEGAAGVRALLGETAAGLAAPFGAHGIKWGLAVQQMAQIGARATPIVVFISFLVGVVLALNGALQLRQFGAAIFIANLVAISMTREMGPLITAIIVSGRTGSAIAAELGTMVVSEEIDALRTMALSPVRFLVVPKVLALVLTLPLLTVASNAAGILGAYAVGVVMLELPSDAYLTQTVQSLLVSDVMTGLVKSVVFAVLIGIVGAYRGFSVRGGPEAVGRATTSAVVTSIIACIVANAAFTAFFYAVE